MSIKNTNSKVGKGGRVRWELSRNFVWWNKNGARVFFNIYNSYYFVFVLLIMFVIKLVGKSVYLLFKTFVMVIGVILHKTFMKVHLFF